AAFNLALLTWLGYMLAKSPARESAAGLLQPQRWEQSLSDIHNPLSADSLIPMFEGMVDRALSRTQTPQGSAASSDLGDPRTRTGLVPPSRLDIPRLSEIVGGKR